MLSDLPVDSPLSIFLDSHLILNDVQFPICAILVCRAVVSESARCALLGRAVLLSVGICLVAIWHASPREGRRHHCPARSRTAAGHRLRTRGGHPRWIRNRPVAGCRFGPKSAASHPSSSRSSVTDVDRFAISPGRWLPGNPRADCFVQHDDLGLGHGGLDPGNRTMSFHARSSARDVNLLAMPCQVGNLRSHRIDTENDSLLQWRLPQCVAKRQRGQHIFLYRCVAFTNQNAFSVSTKPRTSARFRDTRVVTATSVRKTFA